MEEEEEEELLGSNGAGISVSLFDDSVDNHFKAMDTISKLCGEANPDPHSIHQPEFQRLSSSITFLREWRQFNYKPRVVRFTAEKEISEEEDVLKGISLPQFSSATVPKKDVPNGGIASAESSKDFVMYVGGSVWALDWCPRVHDCDIKCEFVAVAAHPPESYYHKMGALLTGRGVVQIWCVLNVHGSKEEELSPKKKRKQIGEHNKARKETSTEIKRPKGRPRKDQTNSEATNYSTQSKRPRGRPRKPTDECPHNLDKNNQYVQALTIQYPENLSGLIGIEGVPKNTEEQETPRNKGRRQRSSIKALSACNSTHKTTEQKHRFKSKARPWNSDDDVCPPLLTQNEEEGSSTMNNQIYMDSEQHPVMINCVSSDISLDTNSASSMIPKDVALPRIVFCLAHNGKVAWDVKWRPFNACNSKYQHQMGYLAVLLGNGSLEVWDVPLPHRLKLIYSSSCKEGTDPRFVKLEPVFKCSNLKCGEIQSIPLTVEWSTSHFHDYLLAGCHDGMVALWKFSTNGKSVDTRPLLFFSADTNPIRAVAWAPHESDQESANIILTAGQVNVKFWDIRDPFRPLWDIHLAPKFICSLDWLPDPRCLIVSCDDGTMRLFSLVKAAYDSPINGKPTGGTKQGMHIYNCSSFAIWGVHVSRLTGMVAYCSADGTVHRFQLTTNAVEKDSSRYRTPHFMCGSLGEEESAIIINSASSDTPLTLKKPPVKDNEDNLKSMRGCLSKSNAKRTKDKEEKCSSNTENQVLAICYGNDSGMESESDETLASIGRRNNKRKWEKEERVGLVSREEEEEGVLEKEEVSKGKKEMECVRLTLTPKLIGMHRVRWNMNKGSERWLCSGGAAGIVRCQEILMSDFDKLLATKR